MAAAGTVVIETSREQAAGTVAIARDAGLTGQVVTDDALDAIAVMATLPSGKKPGRPYARPL